MKKLIVVQCGGSKVWKDNPNLGKVIAKNAYVSGYFDLNKAYAEKFGDHWMILSAKYGFIEPDEKIEDYNVTFKKKYPEPVSDITLKKQVIVKKLDRYDEIIVLGGEEYYQKALTAFSDTRSKIISPLRGLKIGFRMSKINDALSNNKEME